MCTCTHALCGYTRHLRTCRYAAVHVNRPSGISQAVAIAVNRTQGVKANMVCTDYNRCCLPTRLLILQHKVIRDFPIFVLLATDCVGCWVWYRDSVHVCCESRCQTGDRGWPIRNHLPGHGYRQVVVHQLLALFMRRVILYIALFFLVNNFFVVNLWDSKLVTSRSKILIIEWTARAEYSSVDIAPLL